MNNLSISVIIPCYNASKTIIPCLDSVIKQTTPVYEIICVDDGSADETLELLESYKSKITNCDIIIISQNNSGPSQARNRGIESARGNWIAFLDSDDEWMPNKIEVQCHYIQMMPEIRFFATAYNSKVFDQSINHRLITFKMLLYKCYFSTPAVLVKKELLSESSFNEKQKFSEDYRLWLSLLYKTNACYINQVLVKPISNKFAFGDVGLSADLWGMQKGELSNYKDLFKERKISFLTLLSVSAYSTLKFFRRCIITLKRKWTLTK